MMSVAVQRPHCLNNLVEARDVGSENHLVSVDSELAKN